MVTPDEKSRKGGSFSIKAVLFDFDGTLTEPGALNFSAIRSTLGCPEGKSILEFIDGISDETEHDAAVSTLLRFEMEGAVKSVPHTDATFIIRYLKENGFRVGIISRNGLKPIQKALEKFKPITISDFDIIISRDDPIEPKPSGQGIIFAANKLSVKPEEILMVGDYLYDIQAGINAGSRTALLIHPDKTISFEVQSDYVIFRLSEIEAILRLHAPLSP